MEKTTKLKTKDGHIIYGVLNTPRKETDRLIIFIHGLTGNKNEHVFYNAARYFIKNEISTFRFDLYSPEKGGRSLTQCTIDTHASDLETVLSHFKNTFKKVYVVGHSLGGPTIVLADISVVSAVILWDPADIRELKKLVEEQQKVLKNTETPLIYTINWGVEYLIGRKMAEEFKTLKPADLVKNIFKPIKIISAEYGNPKGGKAYYEHANSPKKFVNIKGAGHTFDEEGMEEKLLKETLDWIKQF